MADIVRAAERSSQLGDVAFGYAVINPATADTICEDYYEADRNIYPASTIKTLVAVAALRQVDAGIITLDQNVRMTQPAMRTDCRHCGGNFRRGRTVTVRDLMSAMQIYSSNVATNQLIDLVGKHYINDTADLVGAPSLRVHRKLYTQIPVEPDNPRRNEATVRGYVELYREVSTGRGHVLTEGSRSHLVDLLAHCHANNRFNAEFPEDVTFYHKTGSTSDSSSDAGYYYLSTGEIAILVGLQDFRDFNPLVRAGLALFNLLQLHPLF
jgi:beta-lactamase class A